MATAKYSTVRGGTIPKPTIAAGNIPENPFLHIKVDQGDNVSSGKNRAILWGSPNDALSTGLIGLGDSVPLVEGGPCNCSKSPSVILFFLMLP